MRTGSSSGCGPPHVLHTHFLHTAELVERVARRTGVPFTVRTHSFDVLPLHLDPAGSTAPRRGGLDATRSSFCLGVLAFPFLRPALERAGIPAATLVDCWPVIDHAAFHDRGPRGRRYERRRVYPEEADGGLRRPRARGPRSALPPVRDRVPQRRGGRVRAPDREPRRDGRALEPSAMPAAFRRHGWLVYTGCFTRRRGLAAGGRRGAGGRARRDRRARARGTSRPTSAPQGSSTTTSARCRRSSRGYPEEMRLAGYEHARRSDIETRTCSPTAGATRRPPGPGSRSPGRRPSRAARALVRARLTGPLARG